MSSMNGIRLRLEPVSVSHVNAINEAIAESAAELRRWMPWKVPQSQEETRSQVESSIAQMRSGRLLDYTCWRSSPQMGPQLAELVGRIALRMELSERKGRLGYWIRSDCTGQGYATEACRLVLEAGVKAGLERIELIASVENRASQRVAEKLGFIKEGRLAGGTLTGEGRKDGFIYGRLSETMPEAIPLVDLKTQYQALKAEIAWAIQGVLDRCDFILGHDVDAFESEYAEYCQADFAVGLDSGLSALELGLRALGIGPGDEVITPAHSFIASSSAISMAGATPIWVDVYPDTYNLDIKGVEAAITKRTKAIMPVHLYGQLADMDGVLDIARRHQLHVVEDACQAHGARHRGKRAGSMGDIGAFSFYPGKNLGAYGDAGALVTNNAEVADSVRKMRNYGQRKKYDHEYLAWNRRMDTLQAAVLRVKLPHLDAWNDARQRHAAAYSRLLAAAGVELPKPESPGEHVYHLFVIQAERRADLLTHLEQNGIKAGIHYPIPIHMQEAYRDRGMGRGSFPVAEAAASRLLSLPMYPELSEQQMQRIAEVVTRFATTPFESA
jgi:dTDP-4-amino-4,6-dideoxygalactose transaminase/RimJ/RimL family protein N-acetyltransferase